MTVFTNNVSSDRSVFCYILLLHMLPHSSVVIAVRIPVAATHLVTAVSFTACCTAGVRCQYVSYAINSPVTSPKDAYSGEDTASYKRDQNAANKTWETNTIRHSIGEANERTRKSHTTQLTLLHHVAGLADECTAQKQTRRPLKSRPRARACFRRNGCRSKGLSSPQKLAHESPGVRKESVPAHENPGV